MKGEFVNNTLNGYGEVLYTDKNKLQKGYWINGILGGVGFEKSSNYVYRGYFINSEKNGYGIQIWDDMAKYEGEWKDNNFNGYGIYYFSDGTKYEGEWKNSCKNGFGELFLNEGKKYLGFFKNDKKEGFGIYFIKKNNFILNFWEKGKIHGLGKQIEENDINYQIWEENKIIKENIDEIEFKESFGNKIKNYLQLFEMNNNELMKFMDINE